MEINHLREFIELSKTLNFGAAAGNSFISQSSLSKHIQILEEELGGKLFVRSSRQVQLSDFGKYFLPRAEKLLELSDETQKQARDYIIKTSKAFSLGVVENMQNYMIDILLLEFTRQHPEYSFSFFEANNHELQKMYDNGELNIFSTCITEQIDKSYKFVHKYTGEIVVYINEAHPLSRNTTISLKDLSKEQLFLPSRGSKFLSMLEEAFVSEAVVPKAPFYGSFGASKKFAEANIGISLLPIQVLANACPEYMRVIKLDPCMEYKLGFAYRRKGLSAAEKAFAEFLEAPNDIQLK